MGIGNFYFSPAGGGMDVLCSVIPYASDNIFIMAHEYQSKLLTDALVAQTEYCPSIRIILDRRQLFVADTYVTQLRDAGVQVRFDKKHPKMHSNFVVIDDYFMFLGSYAYTDPCEIKHVDYLIYTQSEDDPPVLKAHFNEHWAHSVEQ